MGALLCGWVKLLLAGMMDLLYVQGRWGAAARLAYQRCIVSRPRETSSTGKLDEGKRHVL